MKRGIVIGLMLGLFSAVGFLLPNFALAIDAGGNSPGQREQLIKDLNLSPEKAQAFLAVGAKYEQTRQEIIARIQKNEADLETTLAASPPDEAKINTLVAALIADHDQLFESFRVQRQEEMALLTPVQRGRFLLALKRWHEERRQEPPPGT